MKLTEEHQKAIAKRIEGYDRSMHCAHDSRELSEHFESGAEWGIAEFGGIQWKPYNLDNLPPVESFQGLILFKSGHVEIATWIVRDEEPGYDWYGPSVYHARQEDITHWAEINLPNQ